MKLLNCLKCNDIVKVGIVTRWCKCDESRAIYGDDDITVIYDGPARILGINNSEYKESLELPKEKYKEINFNWFVVGENIRKINHE